MPSKSTHTREEQKTRFLQQSELRTKMLSENGFDDKRIAKDPQIKHLKAKVKQVNSALGRIAFLEEQTRKLAERKQQKLAEAAAERAESIKPGATGKKKKTEEKLPEPTKKGGGKGKDKSKQDGKKPQKS
ncbi:MAG: hypothetical protein NTY51_07995 [Deltaproteobacteria bacterium]|nr:hypothetical protein [Deltaproteobacteria bacterium]